MKQLTQSGRLFLGIMLSALVFLPMTAAASGNDMLAGGCTTKANCANRLQATPDARNFDAQYGATPGAINSSDTVMGTVTKSGQVMVNGKVVATGAYSYGRDYISGSTRMGSFYKRHTSASFASGSLSAWVHMNNGEFTFAIIQSCGNLVTATPKPVVKPAAIKPAPAPTPAPAPQVNVVQIQAQTQTQAPAPAPAPTPAPAPAPQLPATGAGLTAGLGGLSTLITVGWYYLRSRRSLSATLRNV